MTVMRSYWLFRLKRFQAKILLICFCFFVFKMCHPHSLLQKIWKMNTFYHSRRTRKVSSESSLTSLKAATKPSWEQWRWNFSAITIKTQSFQKEINEAAMVKAMDKVHVMTKADKMMFGYNRDGDANGESLMEGGIYMSIMLRSCLQLPYGRAFSVLLHL